MPHQKASNAGTILKLVVLLDEGKTFVNLSRKPQKNCFEDLLNSSGGPAGYSRLKRLFSIFSALIFDSKVEGGSPSRSAAPNGPATRPLLSINAASIASFSRGAIARVCGAVLARELAHGPESHRSSTHRVSESLTITARSTT